MNCPGQVVPASKTTRGAIYYAEHVDHHLIHLARRLHAPTLQGAEFRDLKNLKLVIRRRPRKVTIFLEERCPRPGREHPLRARNRK
jgi:hypothetical protein